MPTYNRGFRRWSRAPARDKGFDPEKYFQRAFAAMEEAYAHEKALEEFYRNKFKDEKEKKDKEHPKFWEKKANFWQIFIFFVLMQPVQWALWAWLFWK
jgi:hypothetical protein